MLLEQPISVQLSAVDWCLLLGWLGGLVPNGPTGPAEDILMKLIAQLGPIKEALNG